MREFLINNEPVIVFAHGLMFFALGFAVWLQRRRATRLTLTSSLIWLAGFAFVEALAVWGYAFVPIQQMNLGADGAEAVDFLYVLRALIQVLAFVFLLQFGLRLAGLSRPALRWLTALSIATAVGIVGGMALAAGSLEWGIVEWEESVAAAARYSILLPATVLSAVGLWRQRGDLAAAGMPGIKPYAAAAAAVLGVYAVFAGLIVDPAPWAPGGPLNHDGWFADGLLLTVVRGCIGLALCVLAVKLLEIFEVEAKQRLEALDRARAVAEERARFGRDLHDGTIQSIYAAGLRLEAVALQAGDPAVRQEVRQVVESLNGAIGGIRTYIAALRQPPETPASLTEVLRELTAVFSRETGLDARYVATGVESCGPLPDEVGQHLTQILREALANAARHAGRCQVLVVLDLAPDELDLTITDDGAGPAPVPDGHSGQGLRNMRERARRLGGRLTVRPAEGGGTTVALAVPLDSDLPEPETADLALRMGVPS